jgi:hypothetical protein
MAPIYPQSTGSVLGTGNRGSSPRIHRWQQSEGQRRVLRPWMIAEEATGPVPQLQSGGEEDSWGAGVEQYKAPAAVPCLCDSARPTAL